MSPSESETEQVEFSPEEGTLRRKSILFRMAVLSWIVTILALGLFILFIIGLSLEQFSDDLRAIYTRTLMLAALCILVSSVVSLLFARRLSHPIRLLNNIIKRVAAGDLIVKAEISTGDEVESLANSFNRMMDALRKARDELEIRVEERTAELSKANVKMQSHIIDRQRMERTLISTQVRLQHLVTSSPAVIYSCKPDGDYGMTFISENIKKLLGYEPREFLNDPGFLFKQIHMEDLPRVMGEHPSGIIKGHYTHEYRVQAKDGTYRWIQDEMRLIYDVEDCPREIVGTLIDITERRQAEEARKEAEQELEAQRALSMRSDRLRSLGEMAAGIAHELNQPLVGVRGLAEHILIGLNRGWELTEDKLKDRATRIVEQADRMVHIIEHVRMFAREAGKPQLEPVQVNDVVRSGIDMLGTQFRSRGLELDCALMEDLPQVSANPFSLEEVVLNLLNNARDAVEDRQREGAASSSARVLVRTGLDGEREEQQVIIEVMDNGVGIPGEVLTKVFDPFFTTKDPDKGTGLGLAISRSIVEEFGGSLQIQSTPGEGTTVTISLPAETGRAQESA